MTELEERVGPLKVQSEKAKRFLELAEQRKQIELSLWTAQLAKMTVQLRELDDKQTVGRLEQSRIEEKLQQLTGQMEEFFSSMQKAGVQIEQIRTEIGQMEEVIARSDSRIAVLHNDISDIGRRAEIRVGFSRIVCPLHSPERSREDGAFGKTGAGRHKNQRAEPRK